jgi:predicted ATPase/DNA-binding CsgD family transcriptional regulator
VEISSREAEVLTLVGQHLSNAEIAARLFLSVRTVESHVSALLRKLGAPDRRALARRTPGRTPSVPVPLTSFVGRVAERARLAEMVMAHRQVTAVGPGGVGKTRLALAVAAGADFPDGVWFADLVPVTDPDMVAAAVAGALGLGEQPERSLGESVIAALADRHALLILDNCEQVRDGVAPFLERLLTSCPRVSVLATSRARLMVPFERVYPVPALSEPDAVALFVDRAGAAGGAAAAGAGVAEICARLDGMALAIELAAARCPTLGLDGLTAGLSDPLRMLAGGARADDRHRSVRAALEWSHDLLDPADRVLLRRVSVFAGPFTAKAAAEVADSGTAADGLARLAEQSLLVVTGSASTGYRMLETIRQYATEQLTAAGELAAVRARHLSWCLAQAAGLAAAGDDRRARFDAVADDLRAALGWAADRPAGFDLAAGLAKLTFDRTLVGESQQRYEQAAALAAGPAAAASMLRQAAAVAGCRMRGDDMYRLHREAAAAAREAGDPAAAAADLATAATGTYRFWSKFARLPERDEVIALVTEARDLAADDPAARAAVALAEAGVLADAFGAAQGAADNAVPETVARAELAVDLARRTGDPLAESAALDALTGARSWAGDTFGAAAMARHRIELLTPVPDGPAGTHELIDALGMAAESALGAGDLPAARRWARQLAGHPLLAEVGHRATTWLLMTGALAGDVEEVRAAGGRFLDSWQRAGRPARSVLGPAAAGAALIADLSGAEDDCREWTGVLAQLGDLPGREHGYGAVFDAIGLLHHGRPGEALERLSPAPAEVWKWVTWIWLHWYVALGAEAAVLAGHPRAGDRVADARAVVAGNPVAEAIVERAAALLAGDRDRLPEVVRAFEAAGCRYQAGRTAAFNTLARPGDVS